MAVAATDRPLQVQNSAAAKYTLAAANMVTTSAAGETVLSGTINCPVTKLPRAIAKKAVS